jgi:NADH-quinone oxidoreductase subunit G
VTRLADVVFPVAAVADKAGMFVNWEGRLRSFDAVFTNPNSLPDLRVLAGISEELGRPIGFRSVAEARADMMSLGAWDGAPEKTKKPTRAGKPKALRKGQWHLATWKQMLDNGSLQTGDEHLRGTARKPVARLSQAAHELLGSPETVTITGDRGSLSLPVEVADLPDAVVWVPANSVGNGVLADLASPGSGVSVKGADA